MNKLFLTLVFSLIICYTSYASIYKMKEFNTFKEAEQYALKVDGQVFKEQGYELYRVIYGGNKINDLIIISNIEGE